MPVFCTQAFEYRIGKPTQQVRLFSLSFHERLNNFSFLAMFSSFLYEIFLDCSSVLLSPILSPLFHLRRYHLLQETSAQFWFSYLLTIKPSFLQQQITTLWLKTTQDYIPGVLEARIPKVWLKGIKLRCQQGCTLSQDCRGDSVFLSFSLLGASCIPWFMGSCWHWHYWDLGFHFSISFFILTILPPFKCPQITFQPTRIIQVSTPFQESEYNHTSKDPFYM